MKSSRWAGVTLEIFRMKTVEVSVFIGIEIAFCPIIPQKEATTMALILKYLLEKTV